ncbi:hypothetical protein [uncultured Bradyrhizobium sp.]|uniref:hypothetical protein n=1 Tax=uncultured Bradyrhizobium sp. TaxID=199684 RepID=UPI0035CB7C16
MSRLAERAILSFARFVSKEMGCRVAGHSSPPMPGGADQEITRCSSPAAQELAHSRSRLIPMGRVRQIPRYLSALTEASLPRGTIDKVGGDADMRF